MPYFYTLPKEVKDILSKYFASKPVGTKLKYGQSIAIDAKHNYVLKNSYIKLEKDVYALAKGEGAVIGQGSFGKVKYVRSLSTNQISVIKIISFTPSDKTLDVIGNELIILYDLGLYRDTGIRNRDFESKQYIVMLDAGVSLDKYINAHPELNISARIDLAIKICWLVYSLHQGISSRTFTPFAHRDLKPANVALDSAGVMRLIDVGVASHKLDSPPEEFAGAPAYLPNLMTFMDGEVVLRNLDILALKRIIYMPSKILCFEGYKEDKTGKHFGLEMLLPRNVLKKFKLFEHFDTSVAGPKQMVLNKHQYNSDPIILASLLVLARYNLLDDYGMKMHNPILACAVLGMYFAYQNYSDEFVREHVAAALVAYVLQRVAPRHKELADHVRLLALFVSEGITHNLHDAANSKALISLIKVSSPIISRAAALLWQNGFCDDAFFIRLNANEELANNIIKMVFDGKLLEVRKILSPPEKEGGAKSEDRRLTLPSIFHKPQRVSSDRCKPLCIKEEHSPVAIKSEKSKASAKSQERFHSQFFGFPKVKEAVESTIHHQDKMKLAAPKCRHW